MIVDRIENYVNYLGLGDRFVKAFDYIIKTDFNSVGAGRHDISGDAIFALISDYSTQKREVCQLEGHRRHIDLQYIAKGSEWIGYTPLTGQKPIADFTKSKDVAFFNENASFIKVDQGMFAIFFPEDLHMPCTGEDASKVRKVVVKIKV